MKAVLSITLSLVLLAYIAVQLGMLAGRRPPDIGVYAGRLKPPSQTRNSVSSQAKLFPDHPQIEYANIAPFQLKGADAAVSMRSLVTVLQAMSGVTVIEDTPDYVYAQAQTRWLKFVDDVEFWSNPESGVIEVRSASRLGREDFGVNRQRVEAIRSAYLAQK